MCFYNVKLINHIYRLVQVKMSLILNGKKDLRKSIMCMFFLENNTSNYQIINCWFVDRNQ